MGMMKPSGCERETEIARAVRSGHWTEDLRQHAAGCEACGEAMAVAAFLQGGAVQALEVPEPGLMWFKLELRARREKTRRAMRPLVIAERLVALLTGGACIGAALWTHSVSPTLGLAAGIAAAVLALSAGSALLLASSRK